MEDFPARLADLLESTARKIRAMTVGRIANGVNWTALGIVSVFLATLAIIYLLVGTFRLLASVIGVKPAYALITGLLVLGGALLWRYRVSPEDRELARQIRKETAALDKAQAAEIAAGEKAAEAREAATQAELAAAQAQEVLEPDSTVERDTTTLATPPPPAETLEPPTPPQPDEVDATEDGSTDEERT